MNPRSWLLATFILAMFMSLCALWAADMQARRRAAASSINAVKAALTPFERDRARAIEKAKQAGIDPRWVEGGK